MDARMEKAAQIMDSIRRVLFYDWDPYGVAGLCTDTTEYDSWIGGVYRLLARKPTEDEVVTLLKSWAGLEEEPGEREAHLRVVARRLLAIDVRLPPLTEDEKPKTE